MSEQFDDADYGEYVTPSGKTRLRRLPPGVLDRRIRTVCMEWHNGGIDIEAPFTVANIRRVVTERWGRPVSDYGVDQALRRWGRIGAAELSEKPFGFLGFTPAVSSKGFAQLHREYEEFQAKNDDEPQYESGDPDADWSDVEAYEP